VAIAPLKPIRAIHKNDIEWIIELWLRIHGGDPVPEAIHASVSQIIRGLATHLPAAQAKAVTGALGH
jgi:hypothetical protein